MARVLVTGASGALGRRLLPRLVEAGYVVRAMSRRGQIDGSLESVTWLRADLATGEGLAEAVADVEAVVHAASHPAGQSQAIDV